jgi:hypothetical protein
MNPLIAHPLMNVTKTVGNTSAQDTKANVADVKIVGDGDMFQLLCKASSKCEGWMKSTKAMEIPGVGCVVQVTTQQGRHVAEAVTFVPGVVITVDANGVRRLVKAE